MKYILPLFGLMLLVSCKKEFVSPEVKSLYESVMAVHDEVMPEMSTMNKLKRKIRKAGEATDKSMSLLKQLEDADEGMMSWMADFKLDRASSAQAQVTYLKAEQLKIDKVSVDMKTVIADASTYLKTIEK